MASPRVGILLANLGSPASPSPEDVKTYLHQFLNDPYVIDLPKIFRSFLVNGIILRVRPKLTSEAYEKIWTKEGSPLIVHTRALTQKLKKKIPRPVEFGMRYGEPSIQSAVKKLISQGANLVLFLPLYPQYSYAASETAIVEFERVISQFQGRVRSAVIEDFFEQPSYVAALAHSIQKPLQQMNPDLLLLTYHGIPVRQTRKTRNKKNYQEHCLTTSQLLQEALSLAPEKVMTTFQSRLGPVKWIQPFTDEVLPTLPGRGIKKILVASPSFTADCLETLEEIDMRYRKLFLESGGEEFRYVPCLNSNDAFVDSIAEMTGPYFLSI